MMEVSTFLPLEIRGKSPVGLLIEWEVGWAMEPAWALWRSEQSVFPARGHPPTAESLHCLDRRCIISRL